MKRKKVYVHSKNRTNHLVKTTAKNRDTYIYRFYGRESVDGKTREYVEEIELIPGEDNVTEESIKALYSIEDSETYYNRPQCTVEEKRRIADWKAEYIRKFKAKHGYKPHPADVDATADEMFPKNWNVSLDEVLDDDNDKNTASGDKSAILAKAYCSSGSEPGIMEMMDEIAATWPESWWEIYEHILKNRETIVSFARERNVSEETVRKTLNKIRNTLRENDELRKFIRFFD